jgi:hypothetical protein
MFGTELAIPFRSLTVGVTELESSCFISKACAPGKSNPNLGQSACRDCDVGYQQTLSGKSSCSQCATPRFSNAPGAALCVSSPTALQPSLHSLTFVVM